MPSIPKGQFRDNKKRAHHKGGNSEFRITVDNSYNIYYVTTAQAIHQMSWGTNQYVDVSINAQLLVEPGTGVTEDTSGSVYYVDAGQTVHKMYISGGQWVDANLMASTQSGYFTAPGVGVAVDGSANVYYVDAGQTIHEMYWTGTQFVDANLMASSGSGMKVSVAFMITGQVTSGGAGLNGVSVTLSGTTASGTSVSQTTTTATVGGNDGEYWFLAADGGSYTVTPPSASWLFTPTSQLFQGLSANKTQTFTAITESVTLTSTPQPQPAPTSAPPPVTPSAVTASFTNCNDISGTWSDPSGNTFSLDQNGSAVSGTISEPDPFCSSPVTWSVTGQASGSGVFSLTDYGPFADACGVPVYPTSATFTVTISSCSTAQLSSTGPGGAAQPLSRPVAHAAVTTTTWTRTSAPPSIQTTVNLATDSVTTTLSGSQKTGNLSIVIDGGSTKTLSSHSSASSGNSFSDSLGRSSLAVGQYGSVVATWDDVSVTVPVSFYVLGYYRFSQYNTPYENQCSANPQSVWILYSVAGDTCSYKATTLGSKFASQTNINGSGVSVNHGLLYSYSTSLDKNGNLPPGACPQAPGDTSNDGSGTFLAVNTTGQPFTVAKGSCNSALSDGTGLTSPVNNNNPPAGSLAHAVGATAPGSSTLGCGDQVMMIDQNNAFDLRSVQDLCGNCAQSSSYGAAWGNTVGHIDTYTSATTCNPNTLGDYGNRIAIRTR